MKKSKKKLSTRIISTIVALVVIAFTVGLGSMGIDWSELSDKPIDEVIVDRAEEILRGEETIATTGKIEQEQLESIPIVPGENLTVYVFDVGQADCILIENNGEYMIIDAGNNPDGKLVVKQLQSMGITEIKYAVGTHAHEDHIGGLDKVNSGDIFVNGKSVQGLSFKNGDLKLAISSSVSSESKILTNRNIIERAKTVLPNLIYDENPYTVIHEGQIYWVLDAYTVSNQYPYSTYAEIEYEEQKHYINYIRNSVKVIINA